MPSSGSPGHRQAERADSRYQSLLAVMDLVALHARLDELLPDLAACLLNVVDFDGIGLILTNEDGKGAVVYQVLVEETESAPRVNVESRAIPPLHDTPLAALWAADRPVVVHDLDHDTSYPELAGALRQSGKRSLCLVPLSTDLRPIGLIGFASSLVGAYDESDLGFLKRVASQVAVAIDNVRHHQQAAAHRRQLEADRDHWRALLEINNALVSNLDLSSLLAAITPNLRRMVAHDYTNLTLLQDDGRMLGLYAFDPALPVGIGDVAATMNVEDTPFGDALARRRPMEVDPAELPSLAEPLRQRVDVNVRRVCFLPLVTPRKVLGGLTLARRAPEPFSGEELERAFHAAAQIAIAIENAVAFREIALLKDRLAQENLYLEDEIRGKEHFEEIIGDSKALQRVLAQVRSVATTDTAVLLLGETGTGKELIARAIHSMSERRARALVTVNCATSPAGLLESEWFGHEKGAFTGALTQKVGRFELAHQGTLFLDEIGDIPLDLQAKLLRALQHHEIERLGSTRTVRVDFRLVAATNRNLEEMVANREYRSDLYYRLNVFPIRIPPLRDRREDIPPLVRYFVQRFAKQLRRNIHSVSRETMDALCRWPWPGNVRELQNVIERGVILSTGSTLQVPVSELQAPTPAAGGATTLEEAERGHILRALGETRWVIGGPGGAAARLGLKRTTLVSTMRRLGIVRPTPGASS